MISYRAAVSAELLRARGSASARFPLFGLLVCVVQGLGWWFVATSPLRDWASQFGWQTMYATGLLAPLAALLLAMTVNREKKAREGGTWARPLAPRTAVLARFTVATLQLGLFHLAITMPLVLFGLAHGLQDPPMGRFVALWLVLWSTSLLPAALGYVLASRVGMFVTIGVALVWQIVGTLQAEASSWWAQPWAWAVRAVLPVLGIHANGVRLETDSPVWQWSPWLPTIMSGLLAAVVVAMFASRARVRQPRPSRRTRRAESRHEPTARSGAAATAATPATSATWAHAGTRVSPGVLGVLRAQLIVWRGTAIVPLLLAALVAIALVGVIRDSGYVAGFTTWLVVPIGSCLLACLAWTAQAQGWRIVALRVRPATLGLAQLLLCLAALAVVVAVTSTTIGLSGGGVAAGLHPDRFARVLMVVGAAAITVCLWLATRFGPGAAIATTLVVLVISLVFGGTFIGQGDAWIVGFFGWPGSADTALRAMLATGAGGLLALVAATAWFAALRRSASR